jgi:DNA-binding GntR family transcriptional regulator
MRNGAGAAIRIDEFEPARNVGNRLYARLHDDSLSGRLRPGQALSETRLAAQHGISRTPVREVFQRLVKDGLLRVVPQIGSFVAPMNLAAVADSQFIREALECHAVADAAECATEAGCSYAAAADRRQALVSRRRASAASVAIWAFRASRPANFCSGRM